MLVYILIKANLCSVLENNVMDAPVTLIAQCNPLVVFKSQ